MYHYSINYVKTELARLGVEPDADRGQNFLIDQDVARNIADVIDPSAKAVAEIGGGLGALTVALIKPDRALTVIESDPKLARHLRAEYSTLGVAVRETDALRIDNLSADAIVGNLPYSCGTRIVRHFLYEYQGAKPRQYIFMLQREVAQRMLGADGLSLLGVAIQLKARTRGVLNVPPDSFYPQPKVHSLAIELTPRQDFSDAEIKTILRFAKVAFTSPRKTLVNNLQNGFRLKKGVIIEQLAQIGLATNVRPHQLTLVQMADLAKLIDRSH